jgi:hypothetical protein
LQPEVNNSRRSAAPSPEARKIRRHSSVRIPDFAQLLFEVNVDKTKGILDGYRSAVLLLVEIKKVGSGSCQIFDFVVVIAQTDEQARHAFATYPGVSSFGVVIAIGDCWIYREYHRKDMRQSQSPSPTPSERLDPTFQAKDSDARISMSKKYHAVEEIFNTTGFARLQTDISDKALVAVRNRMKYFGSTMFRL